MAIEGVPEEMLAVQVVEVNKIRPILVLMLSNLIIKPTILESKGDECTGKLEILNQNHDRN